VGRVRPKGGKIRSQGDLEGKNNKTMWPTGTISPLKNNIQKERITEQFDPRGGKREKKEATKQGGGGRVVGKRFEFHRIKGKGVQGNG